MNNIQIQQATQDQFVEIKRFYKSHNQPAKAGKGDVIFYAKEDASIVAALLLRNSQ